MVTRILLLVSILPCLFFGQKYDGPRPPMPDLPYIRHADNLVPTESLQAKQEKHKDDTLYMIDGATSPARTPLAEPIFLIISSKIVPDKLQLYKLDTKNGHREILFKAKRGPMPIRMEVTRLDSKNLYRLEVQDELQPGEYSLSPDGSDQVFCFTVF